MEFPSDANVALRLAEPTVCYAIRPTCRQLSFVASAGLSFASLQDEKKEWAFEENHVFNPLLGAWFFRHLVL